MMIYPGMSGAEIEQIAKDVIRQNQANALHQAEAFDIQRYVDVYLEDETGIDPDYTNELPEGVYALTDMSEGKLFINASLCEDPDNEYFLRSTLAHEVGHCLIHVPILRELKNIRIFPQKKNEFGIKLYRQNKIPVYKNPEWQAWRFAGALLMPEIPFRRLRDDGVSLDELANHFCVNKKFVETRMRTLKMC